MTITSELMPDAGESAPIVAHGSSLSSPAHKDFVGIPEISAAVCSLAAGDLTVSSRTFILMPHDGVVQDE
jgi:hypothetical protein